MHTCGLDYEAQVKPPADLVQTSTNGLGNGTHPATAPATGSAAAEPPLALSDATTILRPPAAARSGAPGPSETTSISGPAAAVVTSDGLEDPVLPEAREVHGLPKGPNILVRLWYSTVDAVGALGKVAAWLILIAIAVGLVTLFANSMILRSTSRQSFSTALAPRSPPTSTPAVSCSITS